MRSRHGAFFYLTALTAACLVALGMLAGATFGAPKAARTLPAAGSPVVEQWNKFCASIETQNESLKALNDSLHAQHPDRALDARRLELYTAAIVESERQAALLKAMRKAEFGKAGDGQGVKGVPLSGHQSPL